MLSFLRVCYGVKPTSGIVQRSELEAFDEVLLNRCLNLVLNMVALFYAFLLRVTRPLGLAPVVLAWPLAKA